jgi:hypothetical protein
MIAARQYDRLMRFVRATFAGDDWIEASLGLMDEGEYPAEWYATRLEKLIRLTGWQDPTAQPWNHHGWRRPPMPDLAERLPVASETAAG